METRLFNIERKVDTLIKSQETLAQVMTRIDIQLSQQKRQKGTLQSQRIKENLKRVTWGLDVGHEDRTRINHMCLRLLSFL